MLTPYRALLRRPGAAAFAWSGLLSRTPMAMYNISFILLVQIQYDSYEMAGRVAAIGVLVWALQTVPTARLVDRWGQRRAMIPLTAIFVIGVGLAIWTAMTHGPEWALWLSTALASISGPVGSLTRARWSYILDTDQEIHTAFALEGSLDETLFIAGPALATILATTVWPPLGLVVCAVATVIGMSVLLSRKDTEPPPRSHTGSGGLGWRIPPAVVAVTLISLGLGLMFGAVDISTIGFADENGFKSLSGLLIAALAFGSFAGGLWYGARHWTTPLWKRTIIGAAAVAVGFTALAFSPNLIIFAVIGFTAGATIAPTMTNADAVVQRVVARDQITEGMAWVRIGIGIGVAAGAWIAGYLLDHQGARWGLGVAAIAAILTFLIAIAAMPLLKRGTASRDGSQGEVPEGEVAYADRPPIPHP